MMSAASEAQLLGNFLRMLKAKNVIEVGVYTGYGTLTMAQALPEDGNIVACDVSGKVVRRFNKVAPEHVSCISLKPSDK